MIHVLGLCKRSAGGVVALLLVMAMLVAACGGSSSKPGKGASGASGNTPTTAAGLAVGGDGPLPGLNKDTAKPNEGGKVTMALIAETTGGWCLSAAQLAISGIQVARSIYDYLEVPDSTGGYVPSLADKVTSDPTFKTWTIHVRSGIQFSDGTPLNAQVVADNLEAYRGKSPLPGLVGLLFYYVYLDISKVTVVDPMTVQVDMTSPWAAFPAHLYEYGRLGIMGEAQLHSNTNCFKDMVGTGPFMLKSWVPNEQLVVVKNPHYWRKDSYGQQLPYLDQITFKPVPDGSQVLNGLNSKAFDLANSDDTTTVIPGILPEVKGGTIGMAVATGNPETVYTIFNTSIAPFDNILARQAYAYAYDKTLYNKLRQASLNPIADGPFGPGVLGYVADTGFPTYNLTKAQALVAQYKQQTGKDLSFTLTVPNDAASQASAGVVVGMMKKANITVTLKPEEESTQINDVIKGSYEASAWRNHPGFDPDTQNIWWACGVPAGQAPAPKPPAPNIGLASSAGPVGNNCDNPVNFGRFNDPEINKDLATGRGTTDLATRKAAYEDLNKEFAKQVWEAWGYWTVWTIPYQKNVHGILGPNLPTATSPNPVGVAPYTGLASGTDVSGLWLG